MRVPARSSSGDDMSTVAWVGVGIAAYFALVALILVMIVRANTLLMAELITSRREPLGLSFNSSRMRSKTTTVSLIE